MINLIKFLIISQDEFDTLLVHFNCNLTTNDPQYMITYLFVNFLAYFIIFLSIKIIMWLYNAFFSKRGEII